jgi:hypothetical protein
MLAVLDRHHVDYVVVGGFAANVHGAVRPTKDIDVAPATTMENLTRLAAALRELKAGIRVDELPEGLPFDTTPKPSPSLTPPSMSRPASLRTSEAPHRVVLRS